MNSFEFKNGWLHCEDVDIRTVANAVGTPFYLYSTQKIKTQTDLIKASVSDLNVQLFYAMKANSNQAILKLLLNLGVGLDVVSGGEYKRALAAGAAGSSIVFSGVGKTRDELEQALTGGIKQFNIESFPELHSLDDVAGRLGLVAPASVRVNPDVDAETHAKISTGRAENKFGIPIDQAGDFFQTAKALQHVDLCGVDIHIGSQITSLRPYAKAFGKMATLIRNLRADGHKISRLDLGGGLGVSYHPEHEQPFLIADYADLIRDHFGNIDCEIELEPGRFMVAEAGVLVSKVIYSKTGKDRHFLIVDAAMNDLVRPTLYAAYHEIMPVEESRKERLWHPYDVVGPVCESGDTFAQGWQLPEFGAGDLLTFLNAGAYCAVMASEYNSRPLVPEVLVKGTHWAQVRKRPPIEAIIQRDQIPRWLQ